MYESKPKFFAKALIITVFAVLAIIILVVAINVVMEHVDESGNIKDDDECITDEAADLMKKSGVKNIPTAAKCKKKE